MQKYPNRASHKTSAFFNAIGAAYSDDAAATELLNSCWAFLQRYQTYRLYQIGDYLRDRKNDQFTA
jgi:hypothetical protein